MSLRQIDDGVGDYWSDKDEKLKKTIAKMNLNHIEEASIYLEFLNGEIDDIIDDIEELRERFEKYPNGHSVRYKLTRAVEIIGNAKWHLDKDFGSDNIYQDLIKSNRTCDICGKEIKYGFYKGEAQRYNTVHLINKGKTAICNKHVTKLNEYVNFVKEAELK